MSLYEAIQLTGQIQLAMSRADYMQDWLEYERDLIEDLRCKLEVQEGTAQAADKKAFRPEKKRVKTMVSASRMTFTAGFNRCKLMIQTHYLDVNIESLHANLLDKKLGCRSER